jgi:hypothetical protein
MDDQAGVRSDGPIAVFGVFGIRHLIQYKKDTVKVSSRKYQTLEAIGMV